MGRTTSPKTKPARKLKVFQTRLGFYDIVVAAPSQAAALRAWDTHRNLFADGEAAQSTDRDAIEAALAQPGLPLRRAVGTTGSFGLASGVPKLPDHPRSAAKPPVKPPRPDRSQLDAAEAALASLSRCRAAEEASLRERRAALDTEVEDAESRHRAAKTEAETRVAQARRAYAAAGGKLGKR